MSKEILRPASLKPIPNTFCPGCLHSMANKLVGQCIDELGLKHKTVVVMSVGCSTMGLRFWDMDMVSCRARPRARRRHRPQAHPARHLRLHLSGRRRPRQHRPRRDYERRQPRRALHGHLRQQLHLRHDRGRARWPRPRSWARSPPPRPRARNAAVDGYPTDMCAL